MDSSNSSDIMIVDHMEYPSYPFNRSIYKHTMNVRNSARPEVRVTVH